MSLFDTLNIIYDEQCKLCVRVLNIVCTLDVRSALRFYDAHDSETLEERFPMLYGADVDEAMYAVTEGGRIYRGFFAFRRLLWSSPLTWLLIPLFYFPGSGFFGSRIYAWVAGNRTNFGCRSEVCALPSQQLAEQPREES